MTGFTLSRKVRDKCIWTVMCRKTWNRIFSQKNKKSLHTYTVVTRRVCLWVKRRVQNHILRLHSVLRGFLPLSFHLEVSTHWRLTVPECTYVRTTFKDPYMLFSLWACLPVPPPALMYLRIMPSVHRMYALIRSTLLVFRLNFYLGLVLISCMYVLRLFLSVISTLYCVNWG